MNTNNNSILKCPYILVYQISFSSGLLNMTSIYGIKDGSIVLRLTFSCNVIDIQILFVLYLVKILIQWLIVNTVTEWLTR